MKQEFQIAILAGDGIGPEIMKPCLEILNTSIEKVEGVSLRYNPLSAGTKTYLDQGSALPDETLEQCKAADAILLAAMGLPDIRYQMALKSSLKSSCVKN
jgi:3-isopropylmalate dehydrogenase